jgi:hypothetical protein
LSRCCASGSRSRPIRPTSAAIGSAPRAINGDQLADVDALGRFVDAHGAPLAVAAPFAIAGDSAQRDAQGRVGSYAYVDLGRTVIGALAHDAPRLFEQSEIALDLLRGASALLGPRVPASRAFAAGPLTYLGYDAAHSPLLDMVYGWAAARPQRPRPARPGRRAAR